MTKSNHNSIKSLKQHHREYFYPIPESVLLDQNLTLLDIRVYGIAYSYLTGKHHKCWATNGEFAEILNVEKRSIITSLNRLIKQNHLRKYTEDGERLIALPDNSLCISDKKDDEAVIRKSLGGDPRITGGVIQRSPIGDPTITPTINYIKYNKNTHCIGGEISSNSDPQYQEFLAAHKSSEGESSGKDEWEKLTTAERLDAIRHTIAQYATYPFGHRYVRKISNYLRDKDWLGEINQTILARGPNQAKTAPITTDQQLTQLAQLDKMSQSNGEKAREAAHKLKSYHAHRNPKVKPNRSTTRPLSAMQIVQAHIKEPKNDSQQP